MFEFPLLSPGGIPDYLDYTKSNPHPQAKRCHLSRWKNPKIITGDSSGDDTVVVECKAGACNPVYATQCLTYLRLKKLKTGLVINFGQSRLVDGVERVSN